MFVLAVFVAPKDPAGVVKMVARFPRVAAAKVVEFLKAVLRVLSSPTELREKSIAAWYVVVSVFCAKK